MRSWLACGLFMCSLSSAYAAERSHQARSYLGTDVSISVCHGAGEQQKVDAAMASAWQEFIRVQAHMNVFDAASDVARINVSSGAAVRVHDDVYALIKKSVGYARMTRGAFDITVSPLIALWKEAAVKGMLPTAQEIAQAKALVDARRIAFEGKDRIKVPRGMKIDLGGAAAGFVADAAAAVLRQNGFRDFLVDAGGEIFASGQSCEGHPWRVGISSPYGKDRVMHVVELKDEALSTSGGYEKYVQIKGQRWSHIINPLTGYPQRDVLSATVIAPHALDADVLSTVLCVIGPEAGSRLIHGLGPGYASMVLVENEKGVLEQKLTRDYAVHKFDP